MFAGQLHLAQVVEYLLNDAPGLVLDEVILGGGSAGGIGTFMNADWLAARLPASTKLRGMPEGGFFGNFMTNFSHFASNTTDPNIYVWSPWLGNLTTRYISPAEKRCIADHPSLKGFQCVSPVWTYPYTTTPMFIIQAAVDFEQVFEFSGAPKREVYKNATVASYVDYSHEVQTGSLKKVVVQGDKAKTDGLFSPACLGHTTVQMGWLGESRVKTGGDGARNPKPFAEGGKNPRVDGQWAAEAFSDWYFGRGSKHIHLDDNTDIDTLCSCNTGICGPKP